MRIKKVSLKNFKGLKKFEADFTDDTIIAGANDTGKTTVFDAVNWLLFNKDSKGKQDFNIKRLDKHGNTTPKIDVEVFAVFDINGNEVSIKRTLHEKWVKKRGVLDPVMSGNEQKIEWNEVPMSAKEFAVKLGDLIDDELFKLLTNPLHFTGKHWEYQREMLIKLVGDVTDGEVLETIKDADSLKDMFSQGKSFEEIKKELALKIKRLKDELKAIPIRVDEVFLSLPDVEDLEFLATEMGKVDAELLEFETQIGDRSKAVEAKNAKNIKRVEAAHKGRMKLDENNRNIDTTKHRILIVNNEIESLLLEVETLSDRKKEKLEEYRMEELLMFTDNECTFCKQELPKEKLEELVINFTARKSKALSDIKREGLVLAKRIDSTDVAIKKLKSELPELENLVDSYVKLVPELESEYTDLKNNADVGTNVDDTIHGLKSEQRIAMEKLDDLKRRVLKHEIVKSGEARIKELETQEKSKAQILLDLERTSFAAEAFELAKMTTIEQMINKAFSNVSFSLFSKQINGGFKLDCKATVNGVPFQDVNSAGKINAGLDIINTFCKHYDMFVPVWIDNRETVTIVYPIESQLISLIVAPEFDELNVSLN